MRARHDRPPVEDGGLQSETRWPVTAKGTVEVPARPGQPSRTAKVTLRAGPVEVVCPSNLEFREPACLSLQCVCVQETDPPAGVTPLCWRLLTTWGVPDAAPAQEMVRLYRLSALALGAAVRILQLVDAACLSVVADLDAPARAARSACATPTRR